MLLGDAFWKDWKVLNLHNDMLVMSTLKVKAAFLSVNHLMPINYPQTNKFTRVKINFLKVSTFYKENNMQISLTNMIPN